MGISPILDIGKFSLIPFLRVMRPTMKTKSLSPMRR